VLEAAPTSRLAIIDRARDGLPVDLGLYLISALFAVLTAATATLPPHGAWGRTAIWGYAAATLITVGQLATRPRFAGTTTRPC